VPLVAHLRDVHPVLSVVCDEQLVVEFYAG
jgi:hypothetical protein